MRVLIVEDENHLAMGLKYNLEAEGYQVDVINNGPAALPRLLESPAAYDLMILDLMLPGMSGYEICSRAREANPDLPIVVLSARSLPEDKARAFDCGTDQYVTKPFDLNELLSRVRNLTERRRKGAGRPPVEDVYKFGDAQVDFRTYEVSVGRKRRRLTPMEMKLLELFIRHEGEVLGRAEIIERVWGISPPPATRTVDNFVMRLRKHFEKDPARPRHFLSIRGAGYRFVSKGEDHEEAWAKE